ncbi:hypothetical protein [Marinagarivorans algicola]|uniref:hypothetical protein n=1 Tax=Marinagarivorans algicola TaxID=1513270 RepID=UPI0006B63B3A|nr:hypothetical protein [Marinagarivorans algicola]
MRLDGAQSREEQGPEEQRRRWLERPNHSLNMAGITVLILRLFLMNIIVLYVGVIFDDSI